MSGAAEPEEVEEFRIRLPEIEERLDFAERLLAHGPPEKQMRGGAKR